MTLSQIFSKLNILDAEVQLFRDKGTWRDEDERWGCVITLTHDGTELKLRATAPSGDQALHNAFDKLEAMTSSPDIVNALRLPLLSAPEAVA